MFFDNETCSAEKRIFSHIKHTLEQIGLTFDHFFNEQSLYNSGAIDNVIDILKGKKLIYEDDGATWFRATAVGREQDRVVIKSSGEPTYRLPDIAYHKDKLWLHSSYTCEVMRRADGSNHEPLAYKAKALPLRHGNIET